MHFIIIDLAQIVSEKKLDLEKLSAYECGFDPFGDARHTFSIKFYLVAYSIYYFWFRNYISISLSYYSKFLSSFLLMICFLVILTIGFIYEWKRGALDW